MAKTRNADWKQAWNQPNIEELKRKIKNNFIIMSILTLVLIVLQLSLVLLLMNDSNSIQYRYSTDEITEIEQKMNPINVEAKEGNQIGNNILNLQQSTSDGFHRLKGTFAKNEHLEIRSYNNSQRDTYTLDWINKENNIEFSIHYANPIEHLQALGEAGVYVVNVPNDASIYTINADGNAFKINYANPIEQPINSMVTDGNHLIYANSDGIFQISLDGRDHKTLMDSKGITYQIIDFIDGLLYLHYDKQIETFNIKNLQRQIVWLNAGTNTLPSYIENNSYYNIDIIFDPYSVVLKKQGTNQSVNRYEIGSLTTYTPYRTGWLVAADSDLYFYELGEENKKTLIESYDRNIEQIYLYNEYIYLFLNGNEVKVIQPL